MSKKPMPSWKGLRAADGAEVTPEEDFDSPEGSVGQPYPQLPDSQALGVPQGTPNRKPTHVAQLASQMPTPPNPSVWRRLAAAGLGFAGGYMNTTASRPGGIARPVDPSGAEQALLGVPQYQRQMGNWQQRVKLAEYEDTAEEKAAEAQQKSADFRDRSATNAASRKYYGAQTDALNAERLQKAEDDKQQSQTKWSQQNQVVSPSWNLNPTNQDGAGNAQALPGADPTDDPNSSGQLPQRMPQLPRLGVTPPSSLTPGGVRPSPMPTWAQGQNEPGSQAFVQTPVEQTAQIDKAKLIPVPAELQDQLGQTATSAAIVQAMKNNVAKPGTAVKWNEDYATTVATDPNATPEDKTRAQAWLKTHASQKQQDKLNVSINAGANDPAHQAMYADMGKRFALTGKMPPLGMGSKDIREGILMAGYNYAQQHGIDITSQISNYESNQKALDNMQPVYDRLAAYERTAGDNLDLFISTANKLKDTGSPILNMINRPFNQQALGDANVAAFNAARQSALNEIANIINSPNLQGVVHQGAKDAALNLIPQSATNAQILGVAKILRQDMANRKVEQENELEAIHNRIAGTTTQTGVGPIHVTPTPGGGGTGQFHVKDPKGKVHDFDTQAQADHFTQLIQGQPQVH